jgi:hypothetical protein
MKKLLDYLVPIETKYWLNAQTLIAFGAVALFVHAVLVDVVIHPVFFTTYCIVPLLVPGGILGACVFFRMTRRASPMDANVTGVIALLFLPFLAAPYFWIVFAKTPAWTAALLFGAAHSEVRQFEIRRAPINRGCGRRAEVVDDLRLFPSHLCVAENYAVHFDRQRVQLRLTGDRTPLGFRISHFEHVPKPQEQAQ